MTKKPSLYLKKKVLKERIEGGSDYDFQTEDDEFNLYKYKS